MNERELNDVNDRISTTAQAAEPAELTRDVLFIEDVVKVLRTSRSTIERRRRSGSFPIPELPHLDGRPRWSRQAIERFLTSTTNGMLPRRRRNGGQR